MYVIANLLSNDVMYLYSSDGYRIHTLIYLEEGAGMKKFLCGVADAYFYSTDETLLFSAKSMLDTALEINVSNTEIRGGKGDTLLYNYFHTSSVNVTLTDAQWNLSAVAANIGEDIATSTSIWTEESCTLGGGGAGTVIGTPLVTPDGDTTIYGWVTQADGTTTRVEFTGSNFTLAGGASGEVVCVRYYEADTAARYIEIPANIIPKIGRLVLDAQLFSSNSGDANGATLIGRVEVSIPRLQLSGGQTLSMTSSGVSNTPLNGMALAYDEAGCSGAGVYAKITEVITNSNWYDLVVALAVSSGDDITLATGETETLSILAIPSVGSAFVPPYADLTFTSDTVGVATVNASGVVSRVSNGAAQILVEITNKDTVTTTVDVTCTT